MSEEPAERIVVEIIFPLTIYGKSAILSLDRHREHGKIR
jgi:hypothetical protein